MVLEHPPDLVEEDARLRLGGFLSLRLLLLSSAEEDLAFGKGEPQYGSKTRDAGAGPELHAPTGFWDEIQVDDSGDEVSARVSLLHNSASKTPSLDGEVFEGRRRG